MPNQLPAIHTCQCCGEPFEYRPNQRYCGQPECNKARGRKRLTDWLAKPGNRERQRANQETFRRREMGL